MDDQAKLGRASTEDGKVNGARVEDGPTNQLLGRGVPLPEEIRHLSEEELGALETHLKRKIDLRLLPMVILMYIMNYLDRNNIASARIAGPNGKGLEDELGLTSTQYQVCGQILAHRSFTDSTRPLYQYCLLGIC